MRKLTDLQKVERRLSRMRVIAIVLAIFLISSIFGYFSVVSSKDDVNTEFKVDIPENEQIIVEIPLGAGSTAISKILRDAGVIKFPGIYKFISRFDGYDSIYKSGTHIVSKKLTYREIMKVLSQTPEIKVVTFPEGLTFNQIEQKLVDNQLTKSDTFPVAAANFKGDYKILNYIPDDTENRLEGILFPDTYEFNLNASNNEIIKKMVGKFDSIFKDEYYDRANELGFTPYEIIILASIVEKESSHSDERAIIADIFERRLKSKNSDVSLRKLQSCATIQYIYLNKDGTVKPKITDEDTSIQSPYNTYLHAGLPPTPICAPSEDAIIATLYPQANDYWYFVAMGDADGHNAFSKTYSEQLAAKKKYNQ